MSSFTEIDFRYSDARTEKIYAPALLTTAFVDFGDRSREILRPEKFIVYGPKGSGKTALAAHLELELGPRWDGFVRTEELDEFDFSILSFDKSVSAYSSDLAGWRFLLSLRLLALMAQDEALVQQNTALRTLTSDLQEQGLVASPSMLVLADRTLKRGGAISFKFFAELAGKNDSETKWRPKTPAQMGESLIDYFREIKPSGGKYLLFIDGLDYVLRTGKTRVATIADLISAARSINEALASARVDGKVVILLRDEIARIIPSPDLAKRLTDNGILVEWNPNIRDPFANDLLRIIERRAALAGYTADVTKLWKEWFPPRLHGTKSARYIILRTRFLPRDIISFFRAIQDLRSSPPFESGAVSAAEKNYSDWFFSELLDALQGMIAEEVRLAMASMIREVGMEFSVQDLQNALERRGLHTLESGASLAEAMFETHWLGNLWETPKGEKFYSFKFRGRNVGFSAHKPCALHLGLRKGMNLDLPQESYERFGRE